MQIKEEQTLYGITKGDKFYDCSYCYKGVSKEKKQKARGHIIEGLKKKGETVFLVDFKENNIEWV